MCPVSTRGLHDAAPLVACPALPSAPPTVAFSKSPCVVLVSTALPVPARLSTAEHLYEPFLPARGAQVGRFALVDQGRGFAAYDAHRDGNGLRHGVLLPLDTAKGGMRHEAKCALGPVRIGQTGMGQPHRVTGYCQVAPAPPCTVPPSLIPPFAGCALTDTFMRHSHFLISRSTSSPRSLRLAPCQVVHSTASTRITPPPRRPSSRPP